MNIFQYMTKQCNKNRVLIWANKNIIYNSGTKEFHFTKAQKEVLMEYDDQHRIYKMRRQSGKSTLCLTECIYNAIKSPNSLNMIFTPSVTQCINLKDRMIELLRSSNMIQYVIQSSRTKITLSNGSEIYFLSNKEFSRGISRNNRKVFIYCDEISNLSDIITLSETINAKLLALYT